MDVEYITNWEEINKRFDTIKYHKPRENSKLKELGFLLASAYKLEPAIANDMWNYLINLNVTEENRSFGKFYAYSVFNKLKDQYLEINEATDLLFLDVERACIAYENASLKYFINLTFSPIIVQNPDHALARSRIKKLTDCWKETQRTDCADQFYKALTDVYFFNYGELTVEERRVGQDFLATIITSAPYDSYAYFNILAVKNGKAVCSDHELLELYVYASDTDLDLRYIEEGFLAALYKVSPSLDEKGIYKRWRTVTDNCEQTYWKNYPDISDIYKRGSISRKHRIGRVNISFNFSGIADHLEEEMDDDLKATADAFGIDVKGIFKKVFEEFERKQEEERERNRLRPLEYNPKTVTPGYLDSGAQFACQLFLNNERLLKKYFSNPRRMNLKLDAVYHWTFNSEWDKLIKYVVMNMKAIHESDYDKSYTFDTLFETFIERQNPMYKDDEDLYGRNVCVVTNRNFDGMADSLETILKKCKKWKMYDSLSSSVEYFLENNGVETE